jgi:hypothetical protein
MAHSVDARELIQQGEHFDYNPAKPKPAASGASMDRFPNDWDFMKGGKDDLIAFALEKFSAKLSVRFGEPRLRSEINVLVEMKAEEDLDREIAEDNANKESSEEENDLDPDADND